MDNYTIPECPKCGSPNLQFYTDSAEQYVTVEFKTSGFDEAKRKHEEKRLWNRFLKLIGKRR